MSHRASLYLLFLLAFVSVMVFCCIEGEIYIRQTNEFEKQVQVFKNKVNVATEHIHISDGSILYFIDGIEVDTVRIVHDGADVDSLGIKDIYR